MMSNQQSRRLLALVMTTIAVGVVWLVWLPAYANRPAMKRHLQWLDDKGIDPSAMYYTELDVMEEVLARHRARELRRGLQSPRSIGSP